MDYQPIPEIQKDRTSAMKSASLVLGILGVVLSCFYVLGFPCSALAIILGHLSKGNQPFKANHGRTGFILGIIGFVLSCVFLFLIIRWIIYSSPDFFENFLQQLEELQELQSNPRSL